MKTIIIDGKRAKTLKKLYSYLSKTLKFPDYFGNNLDALADCLKDLPEQVDIKIEYRDDFLSKNINKKDLVMQIFDNADMIKREKI